MPYTKVFLIKENEQCHYCCILVLLYFIHKKNYVVIPITYNVDFTY